jgi:hypothetical protein
MDNNLEVDLGNSDNENVVTPHPFIQSAPTAPSHKARCGQRALDPEGNVQADTDAAPPTPVSAQRRQAESSAPARARNAETDAPVPGRVSSPFGDADLPTAQPAHTAVPSLISISRSLSLMPPAISPQEMARRQAYLRRQMLEAQRLSVNSDRPFISRLTPFAWVTMCLGALALVGALAFGIRAINGARAPELAAAAVESTPALTFAGTAAVAPVTEPALAPTEPPPTAAPTLAPTEPPPTAAPTLAPTKPPAPTQPPAPTAAPGAPWRAALAPDADGNLMAPVEVVAMVEQNVRGYWSALTKHTGVQDAQRDLIDNQDAFLGLYLEGDALSTVKNDINTGAQIPTYERGEVTVRVLGFSEDGFVADVVIEKRGWTTRFFERPDLRRWQLKRIPDQDLRWKLRYDPAQNRWRVSEFVEAVVVKRERPTVSGASRQPARRRVTLAATPIPTAPIPDGAAVPPSPEIVASTGGGELADVAQPIAP